MKNFTSQEIKEFVLQPRFEEAPIFGKCASWPRISIVTPSFNQAPFLERTILSVLNQNYPNLEYLIMDGGSSDGSVEIIKKYDKYLSYWVSEPDGGQANAINKGFKMCSGDILAWLCSDDLYTPGTLKKIAALFVKKEADLIYGNTYLTDCNDAILREHRNIPFNGLFSKRAILHGLFSISQPSMFWSRKLFLNVGGINERLSNVLDNDLIIRFLLADPVVVFLRDFLSCERSHPGQKTQKFSHVSRSEISALRKSYGEAGAIDRVTKFFIYALKAGLYIGQGDIAWLIGRIKGSGKRGLS